MNLLHPARKNNWRHNSPPPAGNPQSGKVIARQVCTPQSAGLRWHVLSHFRGISDQVGVVKWHGFSHADKADQINDGLQPLLKLLVAVNLLDALFPQPL
jgi:hypothetical protein